MSPLHFTGKQRDTETNNDDFGARYFNSGMARWLTPDWSARPEGVPYATLANPQTLNLYAYVGNNPVTHTDPDGHLVSDHAETFFGEPTQVPAGDSYIDPESQAYHGQQAPPQNPPETGEGSQANLARRDAIAAKAEDIQQTAALTQHNPYGANECSHLVSDSITGAGAKAQFTPSDGPPRPPVAGEWANPKANIPGWRILGPKEKPAPGDVAAYSLPHSHRGATGDSAIVTRSGKGLTTVHAGEHGILHDSHFIPGNSTGIYSGVVYRRYTGD